MSTTASLPLALVRVALTTASAVVAGLCFEGAFARDGLVRPVVVAAVGAGAASLALTSILRWRLALSALALAATVPVLGMAAGIGASDLAAGFRDGPHRILTYTAPAPAEPLLLAVPFLAVLAASAIGAELAQRARSGVLAVLPSLAVVVLGLAFGTGSSGPATRRAAIWALLAVAHLGAGRRLTEREQVRSNEATVARTRRQAILAIPVGLVVVALAMPLASRLPGASARERFELRDLVEEPAAPEEIGNPLAAVTGLQGRATDEVQLTVRATARITRLRTAVLDRYDGVEWTSRTEFAPAGTELPGPDGGKVAGPRVTQEIELEALDGVHLPAAERPVAIDQGDQRFDRATGLLLRGEGRLRSYTVQSVLPAVDPAALAHGQPAADAEAVAALELPEGIPEDLAALAEQVAGRGPGYAQAAALERFLAAPRDDGFTLVTEDPPSGHTIGHVRCFLVSPGRCSQRGSTEQFVAAYVVLARSVGLPARVVVGFEAPNVAVGERGEVTGAHATAWAEVKLEGLGWVPFDPVPDAGLVLAPPPEDVAGDGAEDEEPTPAEEMPADEGDDHDDADDPSADTLSDGVTDPRVLAAAALAIGVMLLALPGIVRWRRRERRRRSASTGQQVAGAWDEALDELAAAGVRPRPGSAVREVVAQAASRVGDPAEPLVPLGALVNRALFDRGSPSVADAGAAWQLVDDFQGRRRQATSSWRRILEYFSGVRPRRR